MSRRTLVWYLHTCKLNPLRVFPLIGNKRVEVPAEDSPSFRDRGMILFTKGIEIHSYHFKNDSLYIYT